MRWTLGVFEQREQRRSPRARKRRAADQRVLEDIIAALVCDATHRELTLPGGRVMLPLSNQKLGTRSRYRAPVLSKTLPHVLAILEGDVLEVSKGFSTPFGKPRQTTFALASKFKAIVQRDQLTLQDLQRQPGGESVILKKAREDFWSGGATLEYADTAETVAFRHELERINARLSALNLDLRQDHPRAGRVDLRDRWMRRIFNNGRFDHGGRLYGGFWQTLGKRERAEALLLDGDEAVTIDYRQMSARLLYARAEAPPPQDCYSVPGYESFRGGWKKLFNALLHGGASLRRLPKGTAALLPRNMSCTSAVQALLDYNAPVATLVQEDVGMELMFEESEILIDVLLELERREVAALPIHDAVIVPGYLSNIAEEVMVEVFQHHTGSSGYVTVEGGRTSHQLR